MDTQTNSEDNLPLALTIPRTPVPEAHNPDKGSRSMKKLVSGGKYYRRPANTKNWEPYFNLVKEDVIGSSEHTILLDNGHVLEKSDLAYKGKLLPGPRKIVVNQSTIGHNLTIPSSLAGKGKLFTPKKTVGKDQTQLNQGISRADRR